MKYTAKRSHSILPGLLLMLCALTIYARYGSPSVWQRKGAAPSSSGEALKTALSARPVTALSPEQSGGSFNLPQSVIAGGGETSAGGSNEVTGTIGQNLTGQSSGGSFAIEGGFWPGSVPSQCPTISVTPATLPNGVIGAAYPNQNFTASGGQEPYTFSVTGSLPPGLNLAGNVLSGTPATNGSFGFTIRATDSNGCFGERGYSVQISCPTVTVNPVNPTLPPGTLSVSYTQTFTQTGGVGAITWSNPGDGLPNGLSLNSSTGELSGTPTAQGPFSFLIRAADANGCPGERQYSLTINAAPCPTINVNPSDPALTAGTVGTAYTQTFTQTGGAGAIIWSVSAGAPPAGLTLDSGTGELSGLPAAVGNFTFTIRATDANNCLGERQYNLTINPAGPPGNGLQFYPLPSPVRLLDTRFSSVAGCVINTGAFTNGETRTQAARTVCSTVPANAAAIIGNITVVPSGPGFLTLFPSDTTQPTVANSNFKAGEITNNFFTVGLGANGPDAGAFKIFTNLFNAGTNTEVIIDLTGYYAPPTPNGLYYHPLPAPVRLVETRAGFAGCFQPPQLAGTNNPDADPSLDLQVQGRAPGLPAPCSSIPNDAVVLVGNATTVLPAGLGYLTIYPSDATRPTVASSNYAGGDVINGPFAVKLGADGKFKIYTFSTTDLVVDISGYYSASPADANGAGLLFNPLPKPLRLLETRPDFPGFPLTGCFRPNAPIPGGVPDIRTQPVWGTCSDQPITIPNTARAVVGNVTVINPVGAGFGTFFPGDVGTAPTVATTNYPFPVVFGYNRHYYVGLSPTDGTFKILTQFTSDYIVDVSGYFAP